MTRPAKGFRRKKPTNETDPWRTYWKKGEYLHFLNTLRACLGLAPVFNKNDVPRPLNAFTLPRDDGNRMTARTSGHL